MKLDITHNQRSYESYLRHMQTTRDVSRHNANLILSYNRANITGQVNSEVTLVRAVNEMQKLKSLCLALNDVPLDKLTPEQVEDYQRRKKTNEIMKRRSRGGVRITTNQPITESLYGEWNRTLKKFYKWLVGTDAVPLFIRKLRTKYAEPAVVYLAQDDVDRFIGLVENFRLKVIVGALYNTGLRPQELFKLQFKEMRIDKRDNGLTKITFTLDYSKTIKRTVSVFQKDKVELFLTYLRESHPDWQTTPEGYIFDYSLDVFRRQLGKTTRKYLGRAYRPKDLRSSHACNFVNKVKTSAMDINMGWRVGSSVRQRYISASAMTNEDYIEEIEDSVDRKERQQLRHENVRLQEELKAMRDRLDRMERVGTLVETVLQDKAGKALFERQARKLASSQHAMVQGA